MIDLFWLRGTTERIVMGSGVSGTFLAAVDDKKFHVVPIEYPAEVGDPMPWADSRDAGRAALIGAIRQTPNLAAIGGYSQGAGIAGDLAADIAAGGLSALKGLQVVACALVADPSRPQGAGVGVVPPGWGICGQRPVPHIPTFWAAAFADPITALPGNSLLRALPDLVQYWGLRGPADVARWGQSLMAILVQRRYEMWLSGDPSLGECVNAINELDNFVFFGRHTDAYVQQGLCVRLADALNNAGLG